ncbi:MAG: GtrA family protein [Pseudomonadota bacterium]
MTDGPLFGWQFLKFVGLGACAAGANYLSRFAFDIFLSFEAAVVAAYLLGMVIAFILFQRFVFGDAGDGQMKQISRFTAVNAVGIVVAVVVSSFLARVALPAIGWTLFPFAVAHMGGVMAPTVTSYFGHKFFTYKTTAKVL